MPSRHSQRLDRDEALERALQTRMTVTLIARAVGISCSAVSQWKRVPERHLAIVARITRLSKRELRPDLFEPRQAAAE